MSHETAIYPKSNLLGQMLMPHNIVVDLSSGDMIEAGFAGETTQRTQVKRSSPGLIISDLAAFENDFRQMFSTLGANPQNCNILISESAANRSFTQREQLVSMIFDKFQVQGIWIITDALLGLFATGNTTGVATICSSSNILIVPCYSAQIFGYCINLIAPDTNPDKAAGLFFDSIMKCDVDIRQGLYSQIVLMGDNVPSQDVIDSWANHLRGLAHPGVTVKMTTPANCQNLIWQGGSLVAADPSMGSALFTKTEYEAYGVTAVHRKAQ